MLKDYAIEVKEYASPVMMEFGPEVNGKWFPWNGAFSGAGITSGFGNPSWPDGPERFKQAFQHIVNVFRNNGAHNVTWILHIDAQWEPHEWWNEPEYYDPGPEFVDWIGVSVFGAQLPKNDWNEFRDVYSYFRSHLKKILGKRPVLIAESAVVERPGDYEGKAHWIKSAFKSIKSGEFPEIHGFSYWNSPGWYGKPENNFKISSSAESLKAYQESVSDPFFIDEPILK